MLAILNPILEIFNLVTSAAHYVLIVSFLIGKGIFLFLEQLFQWFNVFLQGIGVVLEELWIFVRELHLTINETFSYIENSTNRGIGCILDGFAVFASEMGRFFTNGKLHAKLLASAAGQYTINFLSVIRGGLILIADSIWFLLTIIPKTLIDIAIFIGDLIVFSIAGFWNIILRLVQNIVDELFKYTIATFVLFVLLKNRKRIYNSNRRWLIKFVWTTIKWGLKVFRFLFVLNPPPQPTRIAVNIAHSKTSNNTSFLNKSNESNCCVVCRDRPKCVLLLPCKHLCMCEECAEFIATMRQAFCPLCRSTVHKQLSVYI